MAPRVEQEELIRLGIDPAQAPDLTKQINQRITDDRSPEQCWSVLTREVLTPNLPFALHRHLFERLSTWKDPDSGPFTAWQPDETTVGRANITRVIQKRHLADYDAFYHWSVTERADFWDFVVRELGIVFKKPYSAPLDLTDGVTRPAWFPNARINIADSCFQAEPERVAVICRATRGRPLREVTYGDLEKLVNRVANGLVDAGFRPGDALAIDMGMTLESIAIYLGILKAGCAVISIADSFTPNEIALRLRIGKATGIFTMDWVRRGRKFLPMYRKVMEAEAPRAIVLPSEYPHELILRDGDLAWETFLSEDETFESVACEPHDHTNILFSSGTTGDPKAICWNHTSPIKAGMDAMFHHDVHQGDVVCWPTNLGWMMGPWLVYASLLNKATIALYEDTPTGRDFCTFVQDAQVTMLGVVPSLIRAWRHKDATAGLDWSAIRVFSSTGECSNPDDMLYLMSRAGYKPIIEYCGGTEIAGGYIAGTVVQPAAPATFPTATLGLEFFLLDENGKPAKEGEVYLVPPSIGLSVDLLNRDHHAVYYANSPAGPNGQVLRRHGDQFTQIGSGYFRAGGRADDTMNLGGIKISSAEIERALKDVPGILETAAIAVPPTGGGPSLLVIYTVLKEGKHDIEDIKATMRDRIKRELNPLFKIHAIRPVEQLPRTASGKVMRRVLRRQYQETAD